MIKILSLLKLIKNKLIRIKDFPESVAIGLAWGASISVTPLLGLHLIICYAGTWLMRGNMIAATVGTVIGNPWTFPFFFYLDYKILVDNKTAGKLQTQLNYEKNGFKSVLKKLARKQKKFEEGNYKEQIMKVHKRLSLIHI